MKIKHAHFNKIMLHFGEMLGLAVFDFLEYVYRLKLMM